MRKYLVIIILTFCSCSDQDQTKISPTRHKDIPADAFYVKGKDIEYWCRAEIHGHRNNAIIWIYDEESGRLIDKKRFSLICKLEGNPMWIEDLKNQIDYFDGKKFHLKLEQGKDSCWLQ